MPNYSLVINSKFQPFSFERYIQPYQIYGKAYREQEDALTEIADKADEIAGKINPLTEKETYQKYKSYADTLKAQSDELAIKGLNPASRRAMLSLRRRYGEEMAPIKAAWERRRELAKEQRALRSTDTSIRFDNDYSTMSLDALMNNPEMSYNSISGNKDVAAAAADMAEQVAKSILSDPTYRGILNSQYFQQKQQSGVPLEEVLREIASAGGQEVSWKINQALRTIRDTVKGQLSSNPAYDESWADSYINRGLYHAIGTAKYDLVKNGEYIDAANRRQLANDNRRIALAEKEFSANYEPDGKGGYRKKQTVIPIQGGGFYDPITKTIRNDKGEIVLNDNGGINSKTAGGNRTAGKSLPFDVLDYTGKGFEEPGKTDVFSTDNARPYPTENLTPLQRKKLVKDLIPYGKTLDDVDIWEDDEGWLWANHYRVVPKGYSVYGKKVQGKKNNTESLDFNE